MVILISFIYCPHLTDGEGFEFVCLSIMGGGQPWPLCPRSFLGEGYPWLLVPGPFQGTGGGRGIPWSLVPGPFRGGGNQSGLEQGYPLPWDKTRTGVTPPPQTGHAMDRIRRGQYASCGHALGLSCSELRDYIQLNFLVRNVSRFGFSWTTCDHSGVS